MQTARVSSSTFGINFKMCGGSIDHDGSFAHVLHIKFLQCGKEQNVVEQSSDLKNPGEALFVGVESNDSFDLIVFKLSDNCEFSWNFKLIN